MKRNSCTEQSEIQKINEIDKRVIYVWISFYSVINAQLPRPLASLATLLPLAAPTHSADCALYFCCSWPGGNVATGTLVPCLRKLVGETRSRRVEVTAAPPPFVLPQRRRVLATTGEWVGGERGWPVATSLDPHNRSKFYRLQSHKRHRLFHSENRSEFRICGSVSAGPAPRGRGAGGGRMLSDPPA